MTYNKDLYPFQSRWMDIDHHRIHYIDEGSGPTILFSHAPLGSSFMYRNLIRLLRQRYRCIALDYPGFGLSTDLPDRQYSILTQSVVLQQFIYNLGLKDIIGLGHDTGGPTLFKIVGEQPGLFKSLILTDTLIFPTVAYPRIQRTLAVAGSKPFQALNARTNLLIRLMLGPGTPTYNFSGAELTEYRKLFDTPQKRRRTTELLYSLRQSESIMRGIHAAFKNQLNNKPTLLLYGEKDPLTQMGIPQRIFKLLQKASCYVLRGESHFPHEGQYLQMSRLIHQWASLLENQSETISQQRA